MTTTHTQSPRARGFTKGGWIAVGRRVETTNDDPNVADIASCNPADFGHPERSDAECCANATLMAASPTMLAALRRLSAAAAARDNVMGDQCALFAAQAELRDANIQAAAAIKLAAPPQPTRSAA